MCSYKLIKTYEILTYFIFVDREWQIMKDEVRMKLEYIWNYLFDYRKISKKDFLIARKART